MKRIVKLNQPTLLTRHQATSHSFFHNIPLATKDELRDSLLLEQGSICCYCMQRIPEKVDGKDGSKYEMKIEHFLCQVHNPLLQLKYKNLLGACTGNEGQPKKLLTCDSKKGSTPLLIDPLSSAPICDTLFKYTLDGEVSSINNDDIINGQINDVLNLNMQSLKDRRSEVYKEVQNKVESESKQFATKALKIKFFEQERNSWLSKHQNKFKPFCMVAVYYLTKKIRQNQK